VAELERRDGRAGTPAYDVAAGRIAATPELEPYRDIILADSPEDHCIWAATCPLDELLGWAKVARG
jgi:hypothetical protein